MHHMVILLVLVCFRVNRCHVPFRPRLGSRISREFPVLSGVGRWTLQVLFMLYLLVVMTYGYVV